MTLFPDIAFMNEAATGCINEKGISDINKASKTYLLVFLFHEADEATLVTNLVKTSLAKEAARSVSDFLLNYSSYYVTAYQEIHQLNYFRKFS